MSEFVNIFVSGTDSSGKELSVQGFFKKNLVYIDGVCYTKLEADKAEYRRWWNIEKDDRRKLEVEIVQLKKDAAPFQAQINQRKTYMGHDEQS